MYSIKTWDVNDAMCRGLEHLLREGVEEQSRNGPVLVAPEPVCTEYMKPRNRVVFSPTRDGNPTFHAMEALWMLAGDNDIEFPCYFNSTYGQYSDDGHTMWDAYGWRWRLFFGWDQLEAIIAELRRDPTSRRCVLAMWNPEPSSTGWVRSSDMPGIDMVRAGRMDKRDDFYVATHGGKAVPCNTHVYFDCRGGVLNMMVCNRSNDVIFGCYGANVVHMSLMQEYMAMRIGVPMGVYRQLSYNYHVYLEKFPRGKLEQIRFECDTTGAYPTLGPCLEPGFDDDLKLFMPWARKVIGATSGEAVVRVALDVPPCTTAFMHSVAVPMFLAWVYRKQKDWHSMHVCLDGIDAPDWCKACTEWVERREHKG